MTRPEHKLPTRPERVEAFANFFKRYMSISTVVAAALPIPVTAFHLIPTLSFQTQELSVYTPLFCFLVLAFIFYSRHALARWMFGPMIGTGGIGKQMLVSVLPLIFIIATFGDVMLYRYSLMLVLGDRGPFTPWWSTAKIPPQLVPPETQIILMVLYLAIFVFAETAFVLMAIKEYLQDYLELEDSDLIEQSVPQSTAQRTPPDDPAPPAR